MANETQRRQKTLRRNNRPRRRQLGDHGKRNLHGSRSQRIWKDNYAQDNGFHRRTNQRRGVLRWQDNQQQQQKSS